jgi:predicted Zn-dependent peptidase
MEVNLSTLQNGLRIVTVESPQLETVSLGIWVNTGSAYETPDVNGISHFIEHMVFKGTKKRNYLQISEDIEKVGGVTNAYTSRESTAFYAKMLKNDLETAIDILADLVMAPTFSATETAKEQDVVVQEIKQSYDDPSDIVYDYFQEAAFNNQPLGRNVLGTEKLVRSFNADKMREYMRHHYAAENMVVATSGNLRHAEFVKMVEERMSTLNPQIDFVKPQQQYTGGCIFKKRKIKQAQTVLGFNGFQYNSPDLYAGQILSLILGGGMSSRLFLEIREKRGLVYTVYSFVNSFTQSGMFGIYAGLNEEEIKRYMPVVTDELKKVVNDYVKDEELEKVKVQMKANLLMGLESSSAVTETIARHQLIYGKNIPIEQIIQQIESVDKNDIQNAARKIFASVPTYVILGDLQEYPTYDEVQKYLQF